MFSLFLCRFEGRFPIYGEKIIIKTVNRKEFSMKYLIRIFASIPHTIGERFIICSKSFGEAFALGGASAYP